MGGTTKPFWIWADVNLRMNSRQLVGKVYRQFQFPEGLREARTHFQRAVKWPEIQDACMDPSGGKEDK